MSVAYVPPGVTVQELTSTSLAPLLANPSSVCLVGLSTGSVTRTDPVTLTRGTAVTLPNIPTTATMNADAIQLVIDSVNPGISPTGYSSTYDYAFNAANHTIARRITSTTLSGSATSAQATFTLTAVSNVTSVTTSTGTFAATVSSGGFPNVTFGMGVSGSNIAAGTTVLAVSGNSLTLSIAATGSGSATLSFTDVPIVGETVRLESAAVNVASVTTANGAVNVTVASGGFPSVVVGMTVTGTGITIGTTVQSIIGNLLILSLPATADGTVSLAFTTTELVAVQGVVGQVVTATTNLLNSYSGGAAVSWGSIPDGNTVSVTYTYTAADYFLPVRLTTTRDVENRFGKAVDDSGNLLSPLTYAASLAFQNGASSVVLQPLYTLTGVTRGAASAVDNATPSVWDTVFIGLQDLEDINLIVPVVGQSQASVTDSIQLQILEKAQDFAYRMATGENIYVELILGEDSSQASTEAQDATLISHAQLLASRYNGAVAEQTVLINTSQFAVATPTTSTLVGGQYMAAAIAGLLASSSPAATITRVPVSGFLAVTDFRSSAAKNTDAGNGLLVIENKGQLVRVRHGITLDNTSAATREINVVRAKQYIIASVLNTLDTQVVGKIVADANAPTLVNNVTIGVLEELRQLAALSAYGNVQSAITSFDPTTMAVSFDYAPSFTVNYINLQFSLDLSASTVTVTA